MTCSDQVVFVIAYDAAGNSSQSPHITFNSCSSTSSSVSSESAVFLVSFGSSGSGEDSAQSVHVFSGSHASIYITGYFEGTINFGGGDITPQTVEKIYSFSL